MRALSFNDGWRVKHLGEEGPGLPVRVPDDAVLLDTTEIDFGQSFLAPAQSVRKGSGPQNEEADLCAERRFLLRRQAFG